MSAGKSEASPFTTKSLKLRETEKEKTAKVENEKRRIMSTLQREDMDKAKQLQTIRRQLRASQFEKMKRSLNNNPYSKDQPMLIDPKHFHSTHGPRPHARPFTATYSRNITTFPSPIPELTGSTI